MVQYHRQARADSFLLIPSIKEKTIVKRSAGLYNERFRP